MDLSIELIKASRTTNLHTSILRTSKVNIKAVDAQTQASWEL